MPFVSEAQRKWMWANRPEQAAEWEKHTPEGKLPERVGPKRDASKADPRLVKALRGIES